MKISAAMLANNPRAEGPLSQVFGWKGYCTDCRLRSDELKLLRQITTEAWLDVLQRVVPDKIKLFEENGIEQYHRLSHLVDHARVWTTQSRTYPPRAVDVISSFSFLNDLAKEYPGYRIGSAMPPYGDWGKTRINWRLVRPGNGIDLGPIHADHWFDPVADPSYPDPKMVRVKIWVPIYLEEGLTGFAYLPGSHHTRRSFTRKQLPDGSLKPEFDEADLPAALEIIKTPCRTVLLFNYSLVHRGANTHRATRTRVSMEFTLELPRCLLEDRYGALSSFS